MRALGFLIGFSFFYGFFVVILLLETIIMLRATDSTIRHGKIKGTDPVEEACAQDREHFIVS